MPAPYAALSIANALILRGIESGRPLTHFRVQKLAILAHGLYYAAHGSALVGDGVFAWTYGPVLPTLFAAQAGMNDRAEHLLTWLGICSDGSMGDVVVPTPHNDARVEWILSHVFETYARWTHDELSAVLNTPAGAFSLTPLNGRVSDVLLGADMAACIKRPVAEIATIS